MLFVSDNHYAEQLLRTVGAEAMRYAEAMRPGSMRSGVSCSGAAFRRPGCAYSTAAASRRTTASPASRWRGCSHDNEPSLYSLLPPGGRQGTLEDYDFTTALGRVRAKSGHLSGVSALAGYVNTIHHGRVAFAFLIDGSPGDPDAAIVRAVDRPGRVLRLPVFDEALFVASDRTALCGAGATLPTSFANGAGRSRIACRTDGFTRRVRRDARRRNSRRRRASRPATLIRMI